MTIHKVLNGRHNGLLRTALLIAILLHAVAFAFWPDYTPSVYRLREAEFKWYDVEPDVVIPPKPQEVERPVIPVRIEASDDVNDDETMPPTTIDPKDLLNLDVFRPREPETFIAFDEPPMLVRGATPVYPDLARRAEVEGTVEVFVTIDETGRVVDAAVARSDADVFNQAAIDAAYMFVFKPALQRDIPVRARIMIPFRFVLTSKGH
jgi:protein TonB